MFETFVLIKALKSGKINNPHERLHGYLIKTLSEFVDVDILHGEFRKIEFSLSPIYSFDNFEMAIEGRVLIKDKAKKKLVNAINKRMNLQHYHPLFRKRLEYRRIIEAQVRVFEKLILDEIEEYKPFVIKK